MIVSKLFWPWVMWGGLLCLHVRTKNMHLGSLVLQHALTKQQLGVGDFEDDAKG